MAKNALAKRDQNTELTTTTRQQRGVTFTPRCDIRETSEELILYADLPGVRPDDLDVRLENGELIIHGRCTPRHADADLVAFEYGVGDFYRSFSVGEAIDPGRVAAELKQGVLTVHLPKREAAKPKRIAIRSE
jgi:HSP20 family protein